MQFVETHAHLDHSQFDDDRDTVVQRALDAGVVQMLTVGADLTSSLAAISLAERYPSVYATAGVHPHDAQGFKPSTLETLSELGSHPKVVAIGEIGLDFYRNYSPHDVQYAVFRQQLDLATELGKPIIVHIRDRRGVWGAYDAALTALRSWLTGGAVGQPERVGVLHCYSGNPSIAQDAIALGFYFGVDGPVTYPNAKGLQSVVAQVPLDRLVLETDCPYLSPQPRRGRRNEPAYLGYIAQKLSELKRVPMAKVARVTTANARSLFGLPEG